MAQQRDTRLARTRASYTGERHTEALRGVREFGLRYGVVPAAADAEQELLEAWVLQALASAFGAHRPEDRGGPLGVVSVSPEPERVVLRVAAGSAADVVQALLAWRSGDGEWVGRTGLHGRLTSDGVVVVRHPQLRGQVVVAAADRASVDGLRDAVVALPDPPSVFDDPSLFFEAAVPVEVERGLRADAAAWSTTLRRLGLFAAGMVDLTAGPPDARLLEGPEPAALEPTAPTRPAAGERRFVLTSDVEALLDGWGVRGVVYDPDLWTWLYEVRPAAGDCDWCGDRVDARVEDTSVRITMAAYDPDLSPATKMLASRLCHAGCKPSHVGWARRVDLDSSPTPFSLVVAGHEDRPGGFQWVVRPVVLGDLGPDADEDAQAALVFVGQVTETHGEPVRAWQDELTLYLRELGFAKADGLGGSDGFAVRVADDDGRPWAAVRLPADSHDRPVKHFWLGRFDPPQGWVAAARRNCRVLLVAGPDPSDHPVVDGDVGGDDGRVDALVGEVDDLLDTGELLVCPAGLVP